MNYLDVCEDLDDKEREDVVNEGCVCVCVIPNGVHKNEHLFNKVLKSLQLIVLFLHFVCVFSVIYLNSLELNNMLE